MPITVKPGMRLVSAVCTTEMIAVKSSGGELDLTIGGVAPVADAADRPADSTVAEGFGGGSLLGKRYVDDADTIELLCTKPGEGVPAVGGVLLHLKDAKPLPASD
jgi:hypothetical protein